MRHSFMRHSRGISTAEYAIILALAVVVGIGALTMLGINTSIRLDSILGSNTELNKSSVPQNQRPVIDVNQISTIRVVRGPNGEISYEVTLNTGAGTQVTSVEGDVIILAMMEKMQKLIDRTAASGGNDPALNAAMQQFKDAMSTYQGLLATYLMNSPQYNYEAMQIAALENSGDHTGPPYYSTEATSSVFAQTEAFLDMNAAFQNLNSLLAANPEYASLQAEVNDIGGIVSTVAIQDQMGDIAEEVYSNRVNPSDIGVLASMYPESLQYLASVQAEASQQAGTNDGSDAYYDNLNTAFQESVMSTANSQWIGDQDVSLANM